MANSKPYYGHTMAQTYLDYVPEGQDNSAYQRGRFEDYVPVPEPQKQDEVPAEKPVVEKPAVKKGKKDESA